MYKKLFAFFSNYKELFPFETLGFFWTSTRNFFFKFEKSVFRVGIRTFSLSKKLLFFIERKKLFWKAEIVFGWVFVWLSVPGLCNWFFRLKTFFWLRIRIFCMRICLLECAKLLQFRILRNNMKLWSVEDPIQNIENDYYDVLTLKFKIIYLTKFQWKS